MPKKGNFVATGTTTKNGKRPIAVRASVVAPTATPAAPTYINFPLSQENQNSLAIAIAGNYAYLTDYGSSKVFAFNLTTHTTDGSCNVGATPAAIAINPSKNRAYVCNAGNNNISVIDITNPGAPIVVGTPIDVCGNNPIALAINPSGTFAYVCTDNYITIIDLSTNLVSTLITNIIIGALSIAIDSGGTWAYVCNMTNRMVIDLVRNIKMPEIYTPGGGGVVFNTHALMHSPIDVYFNTSTYGGNSNYLWGMSGSSDGQIIYENQIQLTDQSGNTSMAINPNGNYIYITHFNDRNMEKINLITQKSETSMTIPYMNSSALAVNSGGTIAYICYNFGHPVLTAINL